MKYYFVNQNQTSNPGWHHEVHTNECYWGKMVTDRRELGYFNNGVEAVNAAKYYYSDADGCKDCCPEAHKG